MLCAWANNADKKQQIKGQAIILCRTESDDSEVMVLGCAGDPEICNMVGEPNQLCNGHA